MGNARDVLAALNTVKEEAQQGAELLDKVADLIKEARALLQQDEPDAEEADQCLDKAIYYLT